MCFCDPTKKKIWCGKSTCFAPNEYITSLLHSMKDTSIEIMDLHERVNILEKKLNDDKSLIQGYSRKAISAILEKITLIKRRLSWQSKNKSP